ncbi:MAG: phosphate ABC transporter substrate-binding protein PstS [Myxococcales bacterium]|nr:phosphate ABC transporter substrate-binding protein PstS [Myxococcales bacterium]
MRSRLSIALLLLATTARADSLLVHGAGATFPYPLYSKWFSEYHRLHPEIKFNYQSIGSGGGIKQITERTVDFGASDAPMTDAEIARAPGILHFPTVIGAVAISCNVPGAPDLRLAPDTLTDLFLGKIAKWNDPRLRAENPGAKLPDLAVTVAHRSDGSGTTAVFTDYLAKVSPEWKSRVGAGKSVKWPVGLGGKGNEGVTGIVKSTPGAVGYIELAYASQNKLPVAALKNRAGDFVKPSVESATAAATTPIPDDYRVSITDAPGQGAYPISAITYLLIYRQQPDAAKGKAIADFLRWALHDGQKLAPPLEYSPLPAPLVQRLDRSIQSIEVPGRAAR